MSKETLHPERKRVKIKKNVEFDLQIAEKRLDLKKSVRLALKPPN